MVYAGIYISCYLLIHFHSPFSFLQVREAQVEKYSFILVVGEVEQEKNEVNVRGKGQYSIDSLIEYFNKIQNEKIVV